MKKFAVGLMVVTLLAIGAAAYAHGPGWWGGRSMMGSGYGNHMMGPGYGEQMGSGYGNHMMGPGCGGQMGSGYSNHMTGPGCGDHMMGSGYSNHMTGPDYGDHMMGSGYGRHMMGWTGTSHQKFLDETADVRKDLHDKRFEYFEAVRNPEADTETIAKLEKEIGELQAKLFENASRTAYGKSAEDEEHCSN
jgi:hypothetical protein